MHKIASDFYDMRKILRPKFWSHGTNLGSLRSRPVRYFSNRSGYWNWYRENGQNIDIASISFRNRGLQNIDIDIEFETEATKILILISNSKLRQPEYWYRFRIRNWDHQIIDIDLEFKTEATRKLISILILKWALSIILVLSLDLLAEFLLNKYRPKYRYRFDIEQILVQIIYWFQYWNKNHQEIISISILNSK